MSNKSVRRILDPAYDLLAKLTGDEDAPPALLRTRAAALDEFIEAYMAQGDLRAALATAEKATNIMQKLAAVDLSDAHWQRYLSISWERLGDVRQAQGELASAVQAYESAQTITAKLAAVDPNNAQWQRDLSVSWERLVSAREDQEDRAGALEAWCAALAISERLAEAVSDGLEIRIAPVVHLAGVARMLDPTDPTTSAEAARLYDRALALLRPLAEARPAGCRASGMDSLDRERACGRSAGLVPFSHSLRVPTQIERPLRWKLNVGSNPIFRAAIWRDVRAAPDIVVGMNLTKTYAKDTFCEASDNSPGGAAGTVWPCP